LDQTNLFFNQSAWGAAPQALLSGCARATDYNFVSKLDRGKNNVNLRKNQI
jgi:hypothetical protein